jgi:hypothetical protein
MNEILKDIETLSVIKEAVQLGADKEQIIKVLESSIRCKEFEIANFEHQLEMEFENGSH